MREQFQEGFNTVKSLILPFSVILIFLIIFLYIIQSLPDNDLVNIQNHHFLFHVINVHAISVIFLTVILICVGWLQFTRLNNITKADFLLRIDNRYGGDEIIKARAIIQRIFRKAYPITDTLSEEIFIKKMADEIKNLREKEDSDSCTDVSYLLNLLDFLETIAYFCRKKYLSLEEINELLGNSLVFYFKIFKSWIYERRLKYNNQSYYIELEKLIEKIDAQNLKEKLKKI